MPINPNIILGLRQGEYKAPDPLEQYGKAQTLKALITQGDVQDLQAQQLRQGMQDEEAVRDAYRTSAGDPNRLRAILQGGGQYKAIQALDKADLEKRAKEAAIGKDEADAKKKAFDVSISRLQHGAAVLGTAKDQATYDIALQIMARDFGPESVRGMSPTFNQQEVQASIARGLTRAQQLEDQRKVEDLRERNRHNLASERASMISAGAAASNAQTARDRLAFEKDQPRVDFGSGMMFDPKTRTVSPLRTPDGAPAPNPKAREDADSLRKEFNSLPEVKNYRDVVPIINAAVTAPNTPAGDFALIYGVGKILDPGSVVREGEMSMVIKSGSPAERMNSYLTYLKGEGKLTPQMRIELNNMLQGRVGEMKASYDAARSSYEGIAKKRGYDSADVFANVPDVKAVSPKPSAGAPAAAAASGKGIKFLGFE